MIPSPSPRRTVSTPAQAPSWADFDDDDGWQDMPVVRSDKAALDLDEEDQEIYHYRPSTSDAAAGPSNATGQHLVVGADTITTDSWRTKGSQEVDSDYTRLRLDEDEESEEVHMRTKYLFNEDKAMTPLSQMQATKELLTEGQRIAYVGLCQLVARGMVKDAGRGWEGWKAKGMKNRLKGKGKEEVPVVESANLWMIKIMARLYQHMEVLREEQHMIESLAEHGVRADDLVPALMATHTVKNPEYDPQAAKEVERNKEEYTESLPDRVEDEAPPPPYEPSAQLPDLPAPLGLSSTGETTPTRSSAPLPPPPANRPKPINPFGYESDEEDETGTPRTAGDVGFGSTEAKSPEPRRKSTNPFGSDDEDDTLPSFASSSKPPSRSPTVKPKPSRIPSFDMDDDEGDIGRSASPPPDMVQDRSALSPPPSQGEDLRSPTREQPRTAESEEIPDPERTPRKAHFSLSELDEKSSSLAEAADDEEPLEEPPALPSLPGVSTSLTSADENVVLDIRWTVLCDLFLVLIADSVYDARSRTFLELVAKALGFEWVDVVRFENRVTDALEIQEAVEKTEQGEIIEGRRTQARRRRYAYMGLAAAGGGLVIGLSAGLLAPVIGAGLGAAFATVGISGTTGFLAGAGGAAMITTTGVLTGANIAGRGMAKRTREVRTFEFRPIHNLKRVTCYMCIPGFMASKNDDVTLPFSVLDAIVGDVFSVLWEPDMMAEMGSALKILTSEVLTSGVQQVLAATAMTALMSAIQWPILLTKLGYLIDNPWSNALDRSRAAGLILADVIMQRHAGVRPISLIGFSLGARSIFYALVELARNKAYGLVQDVFIFGTTVTASQATWLDVRSVVAGRFVNGFASNDWMLGYLFRATSGGLNTVAGLRAVDTVPGLENIDCTDTITGHMSYRSMMPQLLAKVGFPVSADHFDEPDDPEADPTVQERTIVNEAEEEAKKNRKKILGIFPRSNKPSSKAGSGTATPSEPKSAASTSSDSKGKKTGDNDYDYDDDDDDLPPREGDIGELNHPTHSTDSVDTTNTEDESVKGISKTAGFDFKAISKALGKDIDVDKLPVRPEEVMPKVVPVVKADDKPPLERSGSAPPLSQDPGRDQEYEQDPRLLGTIRSASVVTSPRSFGGDGDDDDVGDIAGSTRQLSMHSTSNLDFPSWDQPVTSPSMISPTFDDRVSPPISGSSSAFKSPAYSHNAWSTPSSSSTFAGSMPPRAAPPARPHPAEFLANPFAAPNVEGEREVDKKDSSSGFGFGLGSWGKKTDDPWSGGAGKKSNSSLEEEQNPW